MKIALFHNYYSMPGGEDTIFELEIGALKEKGHNVLTFSVHNDEVFKNASSIKKSQLAWKTAYSNTSYKEVSQFLRSEKPDIAHVHNWFPILSPSIYQAHKDLGIPVVQTLHNYRTGCANGTFRLRNASCQLCRPGDNWNAVKNRCYRGSLVGTLAWKRMVDRGWSQDVFTNDVSHYICPSWEVARRHMEFGIPENKISIIPNACSDNPPKQIGVSDSEFKVVSLGRLVKEKGFDVLINGWRKPADLSKSRNKRSLTLIGDGPEFLRLSQLAGHDVTIQLTGQLDHSVAMEQVQSSSVLVFPSRWSEPFGLGIIEAMAAGKPVIASNIGGPAEIVENGVTGILVEPDNPNAIARALAQLENNPQQVLEMGKAARERYLATYTPATHANALTVLFESLLSHANEATFA